MEREQLEMGHHETEKDEGSLRPVFPRVLAQDDDKCGEIQIAPA